MLDVADGEGWSQAKRAPIDGTTVWNALHSRRKGVPLQTTTCSARELTKRRERTRRARTERFFQETNWKELSPRETGLPDPFLYQPSGVRAPTSQCMPVPVVHLKPRRALRCRVGREGRRPLPGASRVVPSPAAGQSARGCTCSIPFATGSGGQSDAPKLQVEGCCRRCDWSGQRRRCCTLPLLADLHARGSVGSARSRPFVTVTATQVCLQRAERAVVK